MISKLGEIGQIITGNTPKTADIENYSSNDIMFIKPSDIQEDKLITLSQSEFYISEKARKKARVLPPGCILVTCIGIVGKVAINSCECAFNQQINAIIPNIEKCNTKYLAYAIQNQKQKLQDIANAAVVPILNKTQFSEIEITLPPLEEQRRIAALLDKVSDLISKSRAQLDKLDLLVKARFVEMFGDPRISNLDATIMPMTEICTIIDGDRGKNYPAHYELFPNGYCLFLNAKNVTANGFSLDNCMFISKEKDELMRKGHLKIGDIVLTTRGTIGNLAFYDESVPYENVRINSGMVILRLNPQLVSERFFIEQFKILLASIKERIASGSAQPQLPISTMNNILMVVPIIEQQNEYSNFVELIDKSKSTIQKSIDKLETIKKALMQLYF